MCNDSLEMSVIRLDRNAVKNKRNLICGKPIETKFNVVVRDDK